MSVATALQARVQAATRPTRACLQLPRLVRGSPSVRASKIFARRGCAQRTIAPWLLAAAAGGEGAAEAPVVAVEGDIVTINWDCFDEDGEVVESSRTSGEAATFEVGAGDIVGNNLFQAFDEAVRGLAVGDRVRIKAEGGEWKQELLFVVPRDHEEVQRLENRYKNSGGLVPSAVVQLSNGGMAMVVEADEDKVVLDANSALAGKSLVFELELASIERGS